MEDGAKPRDLEDRTFLFAESVRAFVKQLPRTISNTEDVRQLVRASGSVAANWIEADEALSKKDFLMRAKICRKEAKESRLFLRLVDAGSGLIVAARDHRPLHPDADPRPTTIETRFNDFREVDGVNFSFHSEMYELATEKLLQTTQVDRIEINPDIDAALYNRPK